MVEALKLKSLRKVITLPFATYGKLRSQDIMERAGKIGEMELPKLVFFEYDKPKKEACYYDNHYYRYSKGYGAAMYSEEIPNVEGFQFL